MSHTPGNWYVRGNEVLKDIGDRAWPIAQITNWSEETSYNAHLIAAAPEMLEILIELYDRYGDDDPLLHRTANIIQKAKGE